MIENSEMTYYKLCFTEQRIIHRSIIDLTYCVFNTNDYILYFFQKPPDDSIK